MDQEGKTSDSGLDKESLMREVAELRQRVAELEAESEARSRSLFEHSPVSLWEGDFSEVRKDIDRLREEGISDLRAYFEEQPQVIAHYLDLVRVLDVNQAALKLYGADSKEALGSIQDVVISAEALRVFREALIAFAEGETQFEAEGPLLTLTGDKRHTHGTTAILPGYEETWSRILVSSIDITERVRAESQREAALDVVRENEEKYRELFELESDAIFLIDNESGRILEANSAAADLYGFTRDELLRKKNSDLSAQAEETRRVTQTTPVAADRVVFVPLRFHRKRDGSVFPVEITGRFFVWGGRSVHIAAIRDITQRQQAEAALRESEARFRGIIQHSADGVMLTDEEGSVIEWNRSAEEITGLEQAQALGRPVWEIQFQLNREEDRSPDRLERLEAILRDLLRTGQGPSLQGMHEVEIQRPDGGRRTVQTRSFVIRTGQGYRAGTIMRDISQRVQAEQERERLIAELQEALAQVKTLSGMLPICSSCKKIRDDAGYWQQVEVYIRDHSQAEFTHGLCPDCAARLYPEFYRGQDRAGTGTD